MCYPSPTAGLSTLQIFPHKVKRPVKADSRGRQYWCCLSERASLCGPVSFWSRNHEMNVICMVRGWRWGRWGRRCSLFGVCRGTWRRSRGIPESQFVMVHELKQCLLSQMEVHLTGDEFRCSFEQSILEQDTNLSRTTFHQRIVNKGKIVNEE